MITIISSGGVIQEVLTDAQAFTGVEVIDCNDLEETHSAEEIDALIERARKGKMHCCVQGPKELEKSEPVERPDKRYKVVFYRTEYSIREVEVVAKSETEAEELAEEEAKKADVGLSNGVDYAVDAVIELRN
jgi:hypothetical protein